MNFKALKVFEHSKVNPKHFKCFKLEGVLNFLNVFLTYFREKFITYYNFSLSSLLELIFNICSETCLPEVNMEEEVQHSPQLCTAPRPPGGLTPPNAPMVIATQDTQVFYCINLTCSGCVHMFLVLMGKNFILLSTKI